MTTERKRRDAAAAAQRPLPAAASTPRAKPPRLWSVVVACWERMRDNTVDERVHERRLRTVAATNEEAIANVRAMLDPDGTVPPTNWEVIDGGELAPKAADPMNSAEAWASWRTNTESAVEALARERAAKEAKPDA